MPILETLPSGKSTYSKILDLQLNGYQINLTTRPSSKGGKVTTKLSPRVNKIRPKRPMSVIPAIGYQGSGDKLKTMPSWSRPQSAGCTRRNKLAAKFPSQDVQESGYNSELGATYTLSSSQMLQSLMGSCSINAGLDSDSSHASSPQPSLGETIRAAVHLEPGLASKPPLPPTQDLKMKDNENMDDIIAFKFQRWFPDSIIKPDVKANTLFDLKPYESKYNNDEITDESDIGSRTSLTDGETSDRDYLQYSQKHSDQPGKIKKQKNRSSSPIKREYGNTNLKSNLQVKTIGKFNRIKSPAIVVTEEVGLVHDKVTKTNSDGYKSELDVSNQINKPIEEEVMTNYSVDGSFYKNNIDDLHLKSDCSGINHSPPIKLKKENGKDNLCQDDYPRMLLLLDEMNNDTNEIMSKALKDYSENHERKINENDSPKGGPKEKDKKGDGNKTFFEQNDSFLFHSMHSEHDENINKLPCQSLNSLNQNNNLQTLTVETNNLFETNLKQNESINNDRLLTVGEQAKTVNWTGKKSIKRNDGADTSVGGNISKSGVFGSSKRLLRSSSCDSKMAVESIRGGEGASYEDIVSILKVLETEDLEPSLLKTSSVVSSPVKTISTSSSSAREILNFLDEVDRSSTVETFTHTDTSEAVNAAVSNSRFGELLNMNSADLAQTVMKLTLQVEELNASLEALKQKHKHTLDLMKQQKDQEETTIKRNQKFIDQILNEKRQLAEQCEKIVKEMDEKHLNSIRTIEERHKIEIKRSQEKYATAEKTRRDRWIDLKTKKIKELTVKGLEPELDRMTRVHQEEISELRRVHQRQIEEADTAWSRRLATQREQDLADKEVAIGHEREATRHRLELEVGELEKSYQEQRKRMLDEVRREREAMEREGQMIIEQKQTEMQKEWQQVQQKLQEKMKDQEVQHQEEIKKLHDIVESEKEVWMTRQNAELLEKEAMIRQELKRERDRHIEMIIRKLETEATAKEQAIDNKIKRLKETYEGEIQELETSLKELKHRLKEARNEAQKYEDNNSQTVTELHQMQAECTKLKQTCDHLKEEKCVVLNQKESKILALQQELTSMALSLQQEVSAIHKEKERQLQQVYTRVKEAITKKDEAVVIIQKQRDAALEQCCHLEKLLEQQRKNILQLKSHKEQL